ncbi:Fanconi anemia group D2 protein, partial [Varanus komodoensis]
MVPSTISFHCQETLVVVAMISKRKLSKTGACMENPIEELPKTKKPRVSGKKKAIAQDEVVESNSAFGKLLKTAGIILRAGESQNEIAVDGAIFQKKLHQALRKHPSYPQSSSISVHYSNSIHSYCESLIKLLLGIEILQGLVSTIMEMICVSPPPIQHDIIISLPEILEDSQHSEIAKEL